jgi:hypothetical protein
MIIYPPIGIESTKNPVRIDEVHWNCCKLAKRGRNTGAEGGMRVSGMGLRLFRGFPAAAGSQSGVK